MAKPFCLIKEHADKFLAKLKSGEINPEKMNSLSSEELRKFFEGFMDAESAKQTNVLFEKTLLLKNTERGMIRWAEKLSGVTTKKQKKLIERIKKNIEERKKRTFSPEEGERFLNDLVDEILGIGVSEEESKAIFELSKKVIEGGELFNKSKLHDRLSEIVKPSKSKKNVLEDLLSRLDDRKNSKIVEQTRKETLRRIEKYIEGKKNKVLNSNITKLKDIEKMSSSDRIEFLSGVVDKDEVVKLNKKFEEQLAIREDIKKSKLLTPEQKDRNKKIATIKKYVENKIQNKTTGNVKMKDIIAMPEESRANYIAKYFDASEAKRLSDEITIISEKKGITRKYVSKLKTYLSGENPSVEVKTQVDKLVDDIIRSRGDSTKYGSARVALDDYVGEIKLGIKEPLDFSMESAKRAVSEVAGFSKSVLASIDNSFIGRQGIKTLYTGHPIIWGKTLVKSLEILAKSIGGKEMLKGVRAEIYGRKNSMNGTYDLMKLAVGQAEEAYPTSLPEKIPYLGKLFKASQEAFTGSAYYMRAELADQLIEKRLAQGVDLADKVQAESLGNLINSMTGRGTAGLGKLGKTTNTVLFSPKFLQANLDTLTAHVFDKNVTVRDKAEAGKNLLKIIASVGGTLWVADKLNPGSVEWDPRSSDFGKIRIGDTRFDITGGMASIVTLVSRIGIPFVEEGKFSGGMKSSTTGIIAGQKDFNGRGALDLLSAFAENKLAPLAGTLVDLLKKEDFNGDPYTMKALKEDPVDVSWRLIKGLVVPIPLGSAYKNMDKYDASTALAISIIDGLGFGTNTYGFTNNWNKNTGVKLQQLKDKVGKDEFNKANDEYASIINEKILKLIIDDRFTSLSDDGKQEFLNKLKDSEKEKIFERYDFTYEKSDETITESEDTDNLFDEYSK
jgi:hypothetical protein